MRLGQFGWESKHIETVVLLMWGAEAVGFSCRSELGLIQTFLYLTGRIREVQVCLGFQKAWDGLGGLWSIFVWIYFSSKVVWEAGFEFRGQ